MFTTNQVMSRPQQSDNSTNTVGEQAIAGVTRPRPLIMPDTFDGEASHWDDWVSHFESISRINSWDESSKLLWLEVRLVGKARKAWNRSPEESKRNYNLVKTALRNRFEPDSHKDLYAAEFQTRRKRRDETWGDLADNLRILVERAFPDLDERAKEKLSLDRFLGLLYRSDIAFAVRQKKPKCLDDAVAATLEIESILVLSSSHAGIQIGSLGVVEDDLQPPPSISVVQHHETPAMTEMLQTLISRMDQLEVSVKNLNKQPAPQSRIRNEITARSNNDSASRSNRGLITCYSCGQVGHYARGCASRRQSSQQGN